MLSDNKIEKELKKYDPCLFLGKSLVARNGEIMNAPTIYYQKERGLKPDIVKILRSAPCWGDIEDLKKMDSWAWKNDWMQKLDAHNDAIKQRELSSAKDQTNEVSKDVYTLANRLERYGEHG